MRKSYITSFHTITWNFLSKLSPLESSHFGTNEPSGSLVLTSGFRKRLWDLFITWSVASTEQNSAEGAFCLFWLTSRCVWNPSKVQSGTWMKSTVWCRVLNWLHVRNSLLSWRDVVCKWFPTSWNYIITKRRIIVYIDITHHSPHPYFFLKFRTCGILIFWTI